MIEPLPKPAPANNGSADHSVIGTIHNDALPIYIHEATLEQILDYSERGASHEIGGFLLGGLHVDRCEYIEIRHFLPACDARSRAASLTFTHETWARLTRDVDEHFPGETIVGWHHTHPNFGIFLSAYDLFIHRHFFSEPWQVALVVDPHRQELGFFQWRQREVVDCGFICLGGSQVTTS
jgi:proteasome lid subunit RPN8/RPN11